MKLVSPAQIEKAEQLRRNGKREEALRHLRSLLKLGGETDPHVNRLLGTVLYESALPAQVEQGIFYLRRAAAMQPGEFLNHFSLAVALVMSARYEEAIVALDAALRIHPTQPGALSNRALAHIALNHLAEAEADMARALEHGADQPSIAGSYSAFLCQTARAQQAAEVARAMVARHPGEAFAQSTYAFALNYISGGTPGLIRKVCGDFGAALEQRTPAMPPAARRREGARLRVGYVSHDFVDHPVARFIEPLLRHLPGLGFEVTCYSTSPKSDATTERLKACPVSWVRCADMTDEALAARVRADGIDLLVDLGGNTAGQRLGVFARKPAAVQISAIGSPSTSGLSRMDYRMVDAVTDPPGAEAFCTEKLIRLEGCFLCYQPPSGADLPPVSDRIIDPGAITFGSFNNLAKLSAETLDLWRAVLEAVPGSRLVLKATRLGDEYLRGIVRDLAAKHGIDPARLELLGYVEGAGGHLAVYNRVDIALDTTPYCGTTTTCDALLMGVPVVTLARPAPPEGSPEAAWPTHASRVGASLLGTVGVPELIAPTAERYVEATVSLAGDAGRLAEIRAGLRARMLGSILCDGPGYARRVGEAYRAAVRQVL